MADSWSITNSGRGRVSVWQARTFVAQKINYSSQVGTVGSWSVPAGTVAELRTLRTSNPEASTTSFVWRVSDPDGQVYMALAPGDKGAVGIAANAELTWQGAFTMPAGWSVSLSMSAGTGLAGSWMLTALLHPDAVL